MNREVHVRFCEGLGVEFLLATRLSNGKVEKRMLLPYI